MKDAMLIIIPTEKERSALSGIVSSDAIEICGIGKINTASFLTEKIIKTDPDCVLLTGCAGSYEDSGLLIGDIAVAASEFNADEGIRDDKAFHDMKKIGIPVLSKGKNNFFNLFPVDAGNADRIYNSAVAEGLRAQKGKFITLSAVSGTRTRAEAISRTTGGLCETMEGAAAAHVCLKYDIPFVEFRGISNIAGRRTPFDITAAMTSAGRVLRRFLEKA